MIFYTTPEIEKQLDRNYHKAIKQKQKEINLESIRSGTISKYTAHAYISKPARVFNVVNNNVYVEINNENIKIDNVPVNKCNVYQTDPDYDIQLSDFIKNHNTYKITFNVAGKYGPTIYYCGDNIYPALVECNNKTLLLEDEDKYDIGCL